MLLSAWPVLLKRLRHTLKSLMNFAITDLLPKLPPSSQPATLEVDRLHSARQPTQYVKILHMLVIYDLDGCILTWQVLQGLIRLLSTCASGSPLGAKTLLLLGISGILKDILSGSDLVATVSISPALSKPPEQVCITSFSLNSCYNCYCFL